MLRRLITHWLAPRLERIASFGPAPDVLAPGFYMRRRADGGWRSERWPRSMWGEQPGVVVRFTRTPDFVVGGWDDPYLLRWYLIPRNPVLNVYLHLFLRSDTDLALHDHPWLNLSVLLAGRYVEETIRAGGVHVRTPREAGDVKLRGPRAAHRIELTDGPCLTLFVTGPRVRRWGFHCAEQGWIDWERFTKKGAAGEVGAGCEG